MLEPWYGSTTVEYDSTVTVADSMTVHYDSQQDSCKTVYTTTVWQLYDSWHDNCTTAVMTVI